jgi:anaerobic selenocysteine-containing dehydrogenase
MIDINPQTAEALGIKHGHRASVETPRGKIRQKAKSREKVDLKVGSHSARPVVPRASRVIPSWMVRLQLQYPDK